MIRIDEVVDLSSVLQMLCWAAVVHGITFAAFRSFIAAELKSRWGQKKRGDTQAIRTLQWEINHGEKWQVERIRGDDMTSPIALSEAELTERAARLDRLTSTSLSYRIFTYFLTCVFCQAFWVSVAILLYFHRLDDVPLTIASALAYIVPCALITKLFQPKPSKSTKQSSCPGGNCGE